MNLGTQIGDLFDAMGFSLTARWPRFKLRKQRLKKSLFKRNSLTQLEQEGYWKLANMPSEKELTQFYKEEYWDHRGDQDQTVNPRDLSHYLDLRSLAGKVIDAPELKFLNFGAGHGGLSHIMWGIGANIVNIDPSIPPVAYATRWRSFLSENDANGTLTKEKPFNIIYGSHSLEHVRDIEKTLDFFKSISDSKTLFMFEVPDSMSDGNGGKDGKVSPPHTYYYTFGFFQKNFSEIVELTSIESGNLFKHSGNLPGGKHPSGQGDCIRFLGRGLR